MGTLKNILSTHELINLGMTNMDHSIDEGLEEKLKSGNFVAAYSAWNFFGHVWFDSGKFNCHIMQYRQYMETITADSLQEIMDKASEKYGYS